jgi:hypothetical protein
MNTMPAVIEWARRRRFVRHPRLTKTVTLNSRGQLPQSLDPRRIYLIGDPAKWAVFRCPCGRGHEVSLNLAHTGRPRWIVTIDDQHRPTVEPSIDVRDGRRCHFWLKAGQVRWCPKASSQPRR